MTDHARRRHSPYRDPSRPVADRVARLLDRMTIDEKLAQLGSAWVFQLARPTAARRRAGDAPSLADGIGHVTRISGASSLERPGRRPRQRRSSATSSSTPASAFPAIVHEEICSGLMAREATVFPQAIGVAARSAPSTTSTIADAIRRQMRAIGAHQGLSPVLDVCRDPRWGRLEETYGEDPFLVAPDGHRVRPRLCRATTSRDGVVATAKHFVGYGASEGGLNWAPAHLPERELRDVYLRPFEAAVRDAGLALGDERLPRARRRARAAPTAGCSTDLLRGEWGFDGIVVSDYFAVRQLDDYHHVGGRRRGGRGDRRCTPGIDVELPGTDCYAGPLLRRHWRRGRDRPSSTSTRPSRRVLDDEVPPRSVRAAVRRRRPGGGRTPARRRSSTSPGRSPPTASCC